MWNKLIWKFTTIRQLFSVWNNPNFLVKSRNFVQRRLSFVMWRHDFNRAFVVIWNICQGWPIALPTSLSLSVWRQSQWLHNLQQRERKTALILIMLPFLLLRSWWHAIFALRIFLSFFSFSFFSIHPFFLPPAWPILGARFLFQLWCKMSTNRTEEEEKAGAGKQQEGNVLVLTLVHCKCKHEKTQIVQIYINLPWNAKNGKGKQNWHGGLQLVLNYTFKTAQTMNMRWWYCLFGIWNIFLKKWPEKLRR